MRLFVTGEGIELYNKEKHTDVELGRVVGILDLGGNNGDNNFGWSGEKYVVNVNDKFYVLDFPIYQRLETADGVLIAIGEDVVVDETFKSNLYKFPITFR